MYWKESKELPFTLQYCEGTHHKQNSQEEHSKVKVNVNVCLRESSRHRNNDQLKGEINNNEFRGNICRLRKWHKRGKQSTHPEMQSNEIYTGVKNGGNVTINPQTK